MHCMRHKRLTDQITLRLAPGDAARLRAIAGRRGLGAYVRELIAATTQPQPQA